MHDTSRPRPNPEFFPELARMVVLGLTTYGPTLRMAADYVREGGDQRLATLTGTGARLGLELLVFCRICEVASFEEAQDPAPVLPLARALGESLALLGLADSPETAGRLPMALMPELDHLYDDAARAWLHPYVADLPIRQESAHGR